MYFSCMVSGYTIRVYTKSARMAREFSEKPLFLFFLLYETKYLFVRSIVLLFKGLRIRPFGILKSIINGKEADVPL